RIGAGPSTGVGTATFARCSPSEYKNDNESEHRQMYKTFRDARSDTRGMLENIRLGEALDTNQARETVNECVQSVIRHPDALLWMSRIREKQEYTAEHCLNVCILAIAFGRQLGFSEQDLEKIGMCGLLHDVGK